MDFLTGQSTHVLEKKAWFDKKSVEDEGKNLAAEISCGAECKHEDLQEYDRSETGPDRTFMEEGECSTEPRGTITK